MCANDVVISRRVQMGRDINTDATGSEVWTHRHLCVCVSEMHGGTLLCLTVWNTVEKKGLQDSYLLTHPTPPPRFPWNFDLLGWSHRKTHWPPERGGACLCVLLPKWTHLCIFFRTVTSKFQLTKWKHVWITSCSCSCHKLTYFPLTPRRVI